YHPSPSHFAQPPNPYCYWPPVNPYAYYQPQSPGYWAPFAQQAPQPHTPTVAAPQYPGTGPHGYLYGYPPTFAPAINPSGDTKHNHWYGRSKAEVQEDNRKIATATGVYEFNELVPKDPTDDQQFWVVELDGSHVLRNFKTIEKVCRPGRWAVHPEKNNYLYFIREK
ncbi:hypothetical protein M501DRAFT_917251, partial [Patellaria atrata CBS 101060]